VFVEGNKGISLTEGEKEMRICKNCNQPIYESESFVYEGNEFYHKSYCYEVAKQEHHRVSTQNAIDTAHELNDYDVESENFGD